MNNRSSHLMAMAALASALLACAALPLAPTATPTPVAATDIPTVAPTPTIPPAWTSIAAGVELRAIPIPAEGKSTDATALLLRVDPAAANVKVVYSKEQPLNIIAWQVKLGALAVVNAGFFQEDYNPAGLLAADGQRYGLSFDQTGLTPGASEGMFSLAGGKMTIRGLAGRPYDDAEPLDQAVQGLPMLVEDGAPVAFELPDRVARRTVVALDSSGRLLIIHVSGGQVTLLHLRDWLAGQADLGVTSALNLDGGPSTGLVVAGGPWPVQNNSITAVPSVLAVLAR